MDLLTETSATLRTQTDSSRGPRPGSAGFASIGLAVVLAVLSACALLGAFFSYRAGAATNYAVELSSAFGEALYAVGAEESLERKYRLEPSPEVRALHRQAGVALFEALGRARALGAALPLIDLVATKHEEYLLSLNHMFAAVDAGDTALVN